MASVSLSTIRQRFATQINTLDGFDESRNPYDGYGRSPNTIAHKRYSVGIRGVNSRDDDRQRRSTGVMSETEVFSFPRTRTALSFFPPQTAPGPQRP